jgi:hypothetical protein
MTSNTSTNPFDLPPVEAVRDWAKALVAKRGDAFVNWLYPDGLRIETCVVIGEHSRLVRENVGTPFQGGTNVVRRIQLATYPEADFAAPFWDYPERSWHDVPLHSLGKFKPRQFNEIHLPYPLAQPTLARVVEWTDWVPELKKVNIEIVKYTLYELEAEFQQRVAEANANRPSMAEWLRGGR